MRRQCSGFGLMQAGFIVATIGLILVARATFEIPGYWTTFLVGAALFVIGAARRALAGGEDAKNGPGSIKERPAQ
jgi:hypothetical protein